MLSKMWTNTIFVSCNSLVASEPPKFRGSPNNFFNQICLFFSNSSKPVLTEKFFVDWPAKSKHKKTDSWYFVKKIFGHPRNFGGSDATNELLNPEILQFQDSACDRGNKIFRELDVNGDGELDEDEFVKGQIFWEGHKNLKKSTTLFWRY